MIAVVHLSPSWSRRLQVRLGRAAVRAQAIGATGATAVADRIGRVPSWCWPLLVAAAAWPNASWALGRLFDDVDDPLGVVALCAALLMLWQARSRFSGRVRPVLLVVALGLVVASELPIGWPSALTRALGAYAAILVALAAIADRDEPIAPYAGLAILALPLLSAMRVHAGEPLRIITAEGARWLLSATGTEAARLGSALRVDGRLVAVDVPASGLQMAWVAAFTTCVVAWCFRLSDRTFVLRTPLVAVVVLAGTVLRNTVLVAADVDGIEMTDAMHAAVALLAFAAVIAVVVASLALARDRRPSPAPAPAVGGMATARRSCRPRPAAGS